MRRWRSCAALGVVCLAAASWGVASWCVGQSGSTPKGPAARIELPGVENAFRLSDRLCSGAEPRGEATMRALKDLGVRTIISVDGAVPDVEAAKASGLRYIHLPIGYDGVSREQSARIIKAMRESEGPWFVHCHHGKHRGPTAAAVCAMAGEGWTRQQSLDWLRQAGTSPDYAGLFASVNAFTPPSAEELAAADGAFPEATPPPDLVEAMIGIDGRWDQLRPSPQANAEARRALAREATLLREDFLECARLPDAAAHGERFLAELQTAADDAGKLAEMLAPSDATSSPDRQAVEGVVSGMTARCTSCHKAYRNSPKSRARGD